MEDPVCETIATAIPWTGGARRVVDRPPAQLRVPFVPTAGDPYENASFVYRDPNELRRLQFEVHDLDLKGKDIVMQHIRLSGFDKLLPDLLDHGLLYIGASAGAIVGGPDLEPRGTSTPAAALGASWGRGHTVLLATTCPQAFFSACWGNSRQPARVGQSRP
jgi:hypothetical protein